MFQSIIGLIISLCIVLYSGFSLYFGVYQAIELNKHGIISEGVIISASGPTVVNYRKVFSTIRYDTQIKYEKYIMSVRTDAPLERKGLQIVFLPNDPAVALITYSNKDISNLIWHKYSTWSVILLIVFLTISVWVTKIFVKELISTIYN